MKIKAIASSLLLLAACYSNAQEASIKLISKSDAPVISRHIYGQFAEHLGRSVYDGFYRNGKIRTDIVEALKKIKVPNLRWPGGCFADEYHWRDGIGAKASRPVRINTTWGMVEENNSFGTHEFLDLCERIGCEPYIAGNVGTGTPQEMANWIEYLNSDSKSDLANERRKNGHPKPYNVSFWGVGNESWGCGGDMTPDYYANLYKQYANFCESYPGAPKIKKIVSGANSEDYNWTEVCMKNIHFSQMWGLSLHYYTLVTGNWPPSGSATSFQENEYASAMRNALKMEEVVAKHSAIMDKYDKEKRVALLVDEWGIWTAQEPGQPKDWLFQQNSLRDALIAASTLNVFNNHADRVKVANLAQTVNVIHSVVLTKGDEMVLTPTYHVFDFYKVHQDAKLIPLEINSPDYKFQGTSMKAVNASASKDASGTTNISLVNVDPNKEITITIDIKGKSIEGQVLTAPKFDAFNDFGKKPAVLPAAFKGAKFQGDKLLVSLPAKSVVQLAVK
ncbi:alpha-N-arabinofuranosidase [Pedobacter aquatilis]|uniref:alpha-N-arabinofuranosidase n=1 Tax=Pedobacter aquatilis TaxID=351343 RepID=UPI0029302F7E|nr:alpha-L-arabinofuranosidase C-terminal domain-containing protein [Pedobacter aquatilis]